MLFIKEFDFALVIWNNSDTCLIGTIAEKILAIVIPLLQEQKEFTNKELAIPRDLN